MTPKKLAFLEKASELCSPVAFRATFAKISQDKKSITETLYTLALSAQGRV